MSLLAIVGSSVPVAGYTSRMTNSGVSGSQYSHAYINRDSSSDLYEASPFIAGASYTLTKVDFTVQAVGSPTFNLKCAIYSDSGVTNPTTPVAIVGTASDELSTSGWSTSDSTKTFVNLSASIVSGTKYWIVIWKSSGAASDSTNYVQWGFINGGSDGGTHTYVVEKSANAIAWSDNAQHVAGFNMPGQDVIYSTP